MDDETTYGGFQDGQDWLDDLAIENYFLNRQGRDRRRKDGGSNDQTD